VLCTSEHRPSRDDTAPSKADGDGVAIPGLTDAVQLAIGGHDACARLRGGQVACFGRRMKPETVEHVDAIDLAASQSTVCALRRDRTVACWGGDGSGVLPGKLPRGTKSEPVAIPDLTNVAA